MPKTASSSFSPTDKPFHRHLRLRVVEGADPYNPVCLRTVEDVDPYNPVCLRTVEDAGPYKRNFLRTSLQKIQAPRSSSPPTQKKAGCPRGYPAFCMLWFAFWAYSSPARVILSEAYAESNCEAAPSNATAESRADRSFFTTQRCCRHRRSAKTCPKRLVYPHCNNTA